RHDEGGVVLPRAPSTQSQVGKRTADRSGVFQEEPLRVHAVPDAGSTGAVSQAVRWLGEHGESGARTARRIAGVPLFRGRDPRLEVGGSRGWIPDGGGARLEEPRARGEGSA